jgi:hypothetical protein
MRILNTFMRLFLAPLLALVLALVGCDQKAAFERFIPKEEAALGQRVIAQIKAQDYAAVEAQLAPALQSPDLRQKLEETARLIPAGEPVSVQTVGARTNTTHLSGAASPVTTYGLTFEYQYKDSWSLADIVLERRDGKITVLGVHVLPPRTQSLEAENAFTLAGKGALHYIVLTLAVAIPLFVIYALVACIRTRMPKRKWLWLLFIAVGLVQFQFNWTTGAWNVWLLSFALLGAGFSKAGFAAPWVFTLAFPLGAVLFLLKRRSFTRPDAPAPAPQQTP